MSTKLIGRKEECGILQALLDSNRPEFLALYGRRRVGKTFLVREFFQNKQVIFFNVTGSKNGKLKEQINHFTTQLGEVFYNGAKIIAEKNWDKTFETLTKTIKHQISANKKIILFFDELPWMATKNSGLLHTLEYYWNQYWSNNDRIKLIICGSSASWIINKIIKNRGGLHNRITRKIHLEPLNLINTKRFLRHQGINLNNEQITQLYMAVGGIPYYLTYIDKNLSAAQIIEKLAFSKGSFLLEEFDNLFASLFDNHEIYIEIIRIIAQSRQGIGKRALLEKIGKSQLGGRGIEKLSALEEAGFIISFKPHFHKRRGIYYKIIDEYTLFYLRWIEPIRETLQVKNLTKGNWQEIQNSPAWYSWQGYAFEAICYKHINQIRKQLSISPTAIANSWRYISSKDKPKDSGAQIDLLFDRKDGVITLCEIKYSNKPFTIDKQYAKNLLNKRDVFAKNTRTKKQLFLALIASNGVKNNIYMDNLISDVVTLKDLFVDEEI